MKKISKNGLDAQSEHTQTGKPPPAPTLNPLLQLQQTVGNQAVQGLLRTHALQPKLKVSQPEDAHEHEANQIAEQVISSSILAAESVPGSSAVEASPPSTTNSAENINRTPAQTSQTGESTAPDNLVQRTGSGQPLDHSTRSLMETRLGADLSPVRIHTGGDAAHAAQDVKARAFTVGHDVVFGEGEYSPGTSEGQRLLAHELTHVVQQTGASGSPFAKRPQELARQEAAPQEKPPVGPPPVPEPQKPTPAAPAKEAETKPEAAKPEEKPPASSPAFHETLNYDRIAEQIHEGISGGWFFGLGTDEEGVYRALHKVRGDPEAIELLKAAYQKKYKESLESAIRGDFSGTELDYALQLLNMGEAGSVRAIGKVPTTDAEWTAQAKRIGAAVNQAGTDEEAIYAVLLPLDRDPNKVAKLAEAYAKEYKGEDMRERIDSEMSGSELEYALYLMGEGPQGMDMDLAVDNAEKILTFIKEEASKRAQNPPSVDPTSKFFTTLKDQYLKDYLANPTAEEGKKAASEKIGREMEGRKTPAGKYEVKPEGSAWRAAKDRWEAGAIEFWGKEEVPELPPQMKNMPLFKNIKALPRKLPAATDILLMDKWAKMPIIDVPFLVGKPNLSRTDLMADVMGGGKNVSQLMHWATGVKYSNLSQQTMRDLFLAYEMWHLEAWDVFGEDPINDLLAEEQGRILGTELRKGSAGAIKDEASLMAFINQSFLESRAWVGTLLRMRRTEFENWILAKEQKPGIEHWDVKKPRQVWRSKTVAQMLSSGMSEEDVKKSGLVQSQIDIYTLIFESEKWEKDHGPVEITPLQKALVEGKLDRILKVMALEGDKVGASVTDLLNAKSALDDLK